MVLQQEEELRILWEWPVYGKEFVTTRPDIPRPTENALVGVYAETELNPFVISKDHAV